MALVRLHFKGNGLTVSKALMADFTFQTITSSDQHGLNDSLRLNSRAPNENIVQNGLST